MILQVYAVGSQFCFFSECQSIFELCLICKPVTIAGSIYTLRPNWSWKKMGCWGSNLKFNKLKQKTATDNMFKKVKCLSCKSFAPHQSQYWMLVWVCKALMDAGNTNMRPMSVSPINTPLWLAPLKRCQVQYAHFHSPLTFTGWHLWGILCLFEH